ncbi:PASTA domain-containing protein [Senegalia sp. (in: firmicutes)]
MVTPKEEDKVIDQIPKAGTEVKKDEIIELYLKNKPLNNNR